MKLARLRLPAPAGDADAVRQASMVTLNTDALLNIPPEIAVCPYCGTKLTAQFDGWNQEADGSWTVDSMSLDCESEPDDIESEEWEYFDSTHYEMPYVYLLPVYERVKAWVNAHYRFALPA